MTQEFILPDKASIVDAVATDLDILARETSDRFTVALAGGSTPADLYRRLAEGPEPTWWSRAHFFFGDERCVPPDHSDSNYRMARSTLFGRPTAPENIHRIEGELPPAEAAARYEEKLRAFFGATPRFDLALLGLGADAHTASLFPASPALVVQDRWVIENTVESLDTVRITLTLTALNAVRHAWFIVSGAGKKDATRRVLREPASAEAPASLVSPPHGAVRWYLDAPAAAGLAPRPQL